VETFLTALTGELFALLKSHSVLIADRSVKDFNEDAFFQGVEAIERLGDAHLVHALFATRSRQVLGDLSPAEGVSYLSGLLVGADVIGALRLFLKMTPEISSVTLIGEQRLSEYYRLVLDRLGVQVHTTDSAQIAIAGYEAIYKYLYMKDSA
jgi:2-dehydro-3-deoxygalactonokinase